MQLIIFSLNIDLMPHLLYTLTIRLTAPLWSNFPIFPSLSLLRLLLSRQKLQYDGLVLYLFEMLCSWHDTIHKWVRLTFIREKEDNNLCCWLYLLKSVFTTSPKFSSSQVVTGCNSTRKKARVEIEKKTWDKKLCVCCFSLYPLSLLFSLNSDTTLR